MTSKRVEMSSEKSEKLTQVMLEATAASVGLVGLQSKHEFLENLTAKQLALLKKYNAGTATADDVLSSYLTLMALLDDFLSTSKEQVAKAKKTLDNTISVICSV